MNALTMADNNMFLNDQKFGAGDGFLVRTMEGSEIMLIYFSI